MQKWKTRQQNVQQGDIVLIKDDVLFTNHWPLARVTETHPGKDGILRAVTVQTPPTTFKRPVTKLAIILCKEEQATPPAEATRQCHDHLTLFIGGGGGGGGVCLGKTLLSLPLQVP